MINRVYDKIKKFIKENYKEIIFLVLFYVFMTFPLPYYICVSGGTIDVGDRLEIENSYQEKGSFNLAYVSELRGTIPTYLLSYIIPSWERIEIESYQYNENETMDDITNRDKMYLKDANQSAIYVAYTKANRNFTINQHNYYVYFVDARASKDIRIGDELIGVDDLDTIDLNAFKTYINTKNVGDTIAIKLRRDQKDLEITTTIFEEEGTKYAGIAFFDLLDYETNPKINLKFKESETGPSGGLTLSLAIYNKLTKEDITKGRKIVGTGTIDIEGNVGEIGGVQYKLMGAVKEKADIFLVPNGSNYEECIKLQKERGYKIKIIGVDTFDDALEKLKEID